MNKLPTISILIPTLNAARVLDGCLKSIEKQVYPKSKIELIVADGGSTDDTLKIARVFRARIVRNLLKTGEAGKAVALTKARGELIALIDSDNLLPSKDWLKKMVVPFKDRTILGSEPWRFTYRREDNFINRYCALLGVNDPYCYFLGVYDKISILSCKWTGLKIEEKDRGTFLKIKFERGILPTVGANGTFWRTSVLKKIVGNNQYLFDTDVPYKLAEKRSFYFAKVKVGIIHLYCWTIGDFCRKQKRRIRDFYFLEKENERDETYQSQIGGQLSFSLKTLTFIPLLLQVARGFLSKPDRAWFFHPLACWLTLWIYATETIFVKFRPAKMERKGWRQ